MAELRYNPLIEDWVMIASHRQNRPQMPKNWCPFCLGSGKVPDNYDVHKYDNDFPALSDNPPVPDFPTDDFYATAPSYGKCEVILYSPEHEITMKELPTEHILKLVELWKQRFDELSKDEKHKFIFIFENRGDVVGVTMPHPHGQIYAYPFIPKRIQLEISANEKHYSKTGKCLICNMTEKEVAWQTGNRVVMENDHFIAYIPFFSEYPYGTYIVSKSHKQNISQLTAEESYSLADILRKMSATYDTLFDKPFPYMMCMYQAPINTGEDYSHYHFHIVFYPPMRSADKQKFNASSETGAWAHCNPTAPEDCAEEMRQAYARFENR